MNQSKKTENYGAPLVLLSALMFGSYGVWSRLIGDAMGSFFQGWTRALIILILLVPFALIRKEIIKVRREDRGWLVVFLIFTSMTQAPIFYAFNHMDIGTASLLFFVSMFLTMNMISVWFLGEKLTMIKIFSSLIAIAGMCFVFSFSIVKFALFAALMAIVNGIASGGEVAFSKKLSNRYSPAYLTVLSWAIVLITNSVISVMIGETQVVPAMDMSWLWQLAYSISSLFAFWLVIAGLKHIDASIGALIGLLEIVFSIVFGVIVFGESLTPTVVIGGTLIALAAALPSIGDLFLSRKNLFRKIT